MFAQTKENILFMFYCSKKTENVMEICPVFIVPFKIQFVPFFKHNLFTQPTKPALKVIL